MEKTKDEKMLDDLSAAIIFGELHSFYNENLKHTKFYRQNLKSCQKKMSKILQNEERKEFDILYDMDSDRMHSISNRVLDIVNEIGKGVFSNTVINAELIMANNIDPKSIGGIVKKVLDKHQKKQYEFKRN